MRSERNTISYWGIVDTKENGEDVSNSMCLAVFKTKIFVTNSEIDGYGNT